MKRTFYQLLTLLGVVALGYTSLNAQTYSNQGHRWGCVNYAAINEIEILDADGNTVYEKTPDGCNGGAAHYNVISTTPSFSLESQKTYTIKFKVAANITINKNFSCWIDLNGDGDYNDVNEFLSEEWGTGSGAQPLQNYQGGVTYTETFTVGCAAAPFTGDTRIRFRSNLQNYGANNLSGSSEALMNYGETEEYTFNLISDLTVSSAFIGDPIAYKDVDYYMTSANGSKNFDWDENADGYDSIGFQTITWRWGSNGTKMMKTRSENCAGIDSSTTNIVVQDVTAAPVVDFIADVTLGNPGAEINFIDLTANGVSTRTWTMYDSFMNPVLYMDNSDLIAGKTLKFPAFNFMNKGLYTVCLEATNAKGSDKVCKSNYISIVNPSDVILGGGDQISAASKGNVYDNGGNSNFYTGIATQKNNNLLIAPCGATKITLAINSFNMEDFGDVLFVFDGKDETGTPLHPLGGLNKGNYSSFTSLVATSGNMYLYYVSDDAGFNDGFSASWSSDLGTTTTPVASFKSEYTDIYATAHTKFISTATNLTGAPRINWAIQGNYYSGNEIEHIFTTPGTHEVCMMVLSCAGNDTTCSNVTAVAPTSATKADFFASTTRPTTTEIVSFTATTDKANSYEWYITPEGNYTFENGTDKNSKNPDIKFKEAGCYEVIFKAWNSSDRPLTTKTVQKIDYICVVKKCDPVVNFQSASIGVETVTIANNGVNALVSNTSAGVNGYQDFSNSKIANVKYGETYDVTLERSDLTDPWNARIWLDVNGDGNFISSEMLVQEGPDTTGKITTSITMPSYDVNLSSSITMRIGIGYNNLFAEPCASNVGEYEDYGIKLVRDEDIPEITVLKGDVVTIGKGALGYYLAQDLPGVGYTAADATEGDITSKVVVTTDLEEDVVGLYTIHYNVKDASGNSAITKTRTVKVVVDNEDPTIALVGGNMTIAVNDKKTCGRPGLSNEMYVELGATANDNVAGNLNSVIVISGMVDVKTTGTYVLTYSVSDASGNSASVQRTVEVIDTIAPIINFNGSNLIDLGKAWVDQTSICDNYDGNVTLVRTAGPKGFPDSYKKGTYTVTYNATDAAGNVANTMVRVYTVGDNKAPIISLNSSDTVIHDVNMPYNSIPPSATDNYDSDDDVSILSYGDVIVFVLGTYQEMFVAKDLSGNSDTAYRYVKVVDRIRPTISGDDIYNPLYRDFNPMSGLNLNDNLNTDVELSPNVEVVNSNVNIHVTGVYSISYIVTDLSGNVSLRYVRNVFIGADYEPTVGIDDIDLAKLINVYPIPSNGDVTISLSTKEAVTAQVVNMMGSVVMDLGTITDGQNIDLTAQASGVYFVRFTSGSVTTMKKIILN